MRHESYITFGCWGFAPNYDLPLVFRIMVEDERRWRRLTPSN
jgi:hypothetical protein